MKKAGHQREPGISVSRSVFALVTDQDRYFFGQEANRVDTIGMIEHDKRAILEEVMRQNRSNSSRSWRKMKPSGKLIRFF